nr:hypothetical protein [Tanacetum cinerariifolium]
MSRYNPSKDRDLIIGRRSKARKGKWACSKLVGLPTWHLEVVGIGYGYGEGLVVGTEKWEKGQEKSVQVLGEKHCAENSVLNHRLDCGVDLLRLMRMNYGWYIVPTGRVIVPTGRYIVPTSRVIVATGRDIWNAVKARFGGNAESKKMRKSMLKQEFLEFRIREEEGLHKGYDRMQKILSQLNQLKAKPDAEDINLKFLRALPSSWSLVALTLKTKGRLEFLSFDDLYYKLKTLEVDVKGYSTFSSSQYVGPSHYAFVSATEQQLAYEDLKQIKKLDLEEIDLKWQMAMLSVRVHKFEQKAERKIDFDKKESARFNKQKVRCYKCQQRGHFARECRAKGGNDKQRYSSFKIKEIGKKEEDSKALITFDTLVDWTNHDSKSDGVIAAKEFGMIAGYDSKNSIKEGAPKLYNLITGANSEEANTAGDAGEFFLMGVTFKAYKNSLKSLEKQKRVLQRNQLTLEDKIRVLSIELEKTSNMLKL